jgi:hypothetical protein
VSGVKSEDWWPDPGTHELTFALELDGLKVLEWDPSCGVSRDDWKAAFPADEWLTGTIDYLVIGEGWPWLDDLKTGRWRVDPVTSKQLRSYALYPWVLSGCAPDFEIEVSITQWTKYPLSGSPERSWHRLTHLDLMEHLEDLRWAVEHPFEVNAGEEQCRFCECRPFCPAWRDEETDSSDLVVLHGGD